MTDKERCQTESRHDNFVFSNSSQHIYL